MMSGAFDNAPLEVRENIYPLPFMRSEIVMTSFQKDIAVFIANPAISYVEYDNSVYKNRIGYLLKGVYITADSLDEDTLPPVDEYRNGRCYRIYYRKQFLKTLVSDMEMKKLYQQFENDYQNKPSYIPTYAVEFASLTGMRVSEISALTWNCITDSYIIINKSEKYNRQTKEYSIGESKNGKERVFPVTDKIRNLLERVKKTELKYGFICEWVFANEGGRIHSSVISSCSKNKCRQVGIDEKGIHAYRRTVNSMMRHDGVSAIVAASLLGHTAEVNNTYYTFDISNMEEKQQIISRINAELPIASS